MKKHLSLLFLISLLVNCADPEPGVPDEWLPSDYEHRISPVGNYELYRITRSWRIITETSNDHHSDEPTMNCDYFSSIEFKEDGTFEYIDYNYDNNTSYTEDCSNYEIVTGNYIDVLHTTHLFSGELNFNDTFRGSNTYEGFYVSYDAGYDAPNMKIEFKIDLQDITYTYHLYYRKI